MADVTKGSREAAKKTTKEDTNKILVQLELSSKGDNLAVLMATKKVDLLQLAIDLQACFVKSYKQHSENKIVKDAKRHENDNQFLINITNMLNKWLKARKQLAVMPDMANIVAAFDSAFKAIYEFIALQDTVLPKPTQAMTDAIGAIQLVVPAFLAQDRIDALFAKAPAPAADDEQRLLFVQTALRNVDRADQSPPTLQFVQLLVSEERRIMEEIQRKKDTEKAAALSRLGPMARKLQELRERQAAEAAARDAELKRKGQEDVGAPNIAASLAPVGSFVSVGADPRDLSVSALEDVEQNFTAARDYVLGCVHNLTLPDTIDIIQQKLQTLTPEQPDGLTPAVLAQALLQLRQLLDSARANRAKAEAEIAGMQLDQLSAEDCSQRIQQRLMELNLKRCDDAEVYMKQLLTVQGNLIDQASLRAQQKFAAFEREVLNQPATTSEHLARVADALRALEENRGIDKYERFYYKKLLDDAAIKLQTYQQQVTELLAKFDDRIAALKPTERPAACELELKDSNAQIVEPNVVKYYNLELQSKLTRLQELLAAARGKLQELLADLPANNPQPRMQVITAEIGRLGNDGGVSPDLREYQVFFCQQELERLRQVLTASKGMFAQRVAPFSFYNHNAIDCSWSFDGAQVAAKLAAEFAREFAADAEIAAYYNFLVVDAQQKLPELMTQAVQQFAGYNFAAHAIEKNARSEALQAKLEEIFPADAAAVENAADLLQGHVLYLLQCSLNVLKISAAIVKDIVPNGAAPTDVLPENIRRLAVVQSQIRALEDPAVLAVLFVKWRATLLEQEPALQAAVREQQARLAANALLSGGGSSGTTLVALAADVGRRPDPSGAEMKSAKPDGDADDAKKKKLGCGWW